MKTSVVLVGVLCMLATAASVQAQDVIRSETVVEQPAPVVERSIIEQRVVQPAPLAAPIVTSFPPNPRDGDEVRMNGRQYEWDSETAVWKLDED